MFWWDGIESVGKFILANPYRITRLLNLEVQYAKQTAKIVYFTRFPKL